MHQGSLKEEHSEETSKGQGVKIEKWKKPMEIQMMAS